MPSASSIDLSTLSDEVLVRLRAGIDLEQWRRAIAGPRVDIWQDLLANGSDDEIIAQAQLEYPDAPITLADRYAQVHYYQETQLGGSHPRRPVFLRGARQIRIRLHGFSDRASPNGWACDVFRRAMRMIRLTAFEQEAFERDFAQALRARLRDRYHLTYAFRDRTDWRSVTGWGENHCIIGGRGCDLSNSEMANVKALFAIVAKSRKLDAKARKAMAVRHMHERLANAPA